MQALQKLFRRGSHPPANWDIQNWAPKFYSDMMVRELSEADRAKYDSATTQKAKTTVLLNAEIDPVIEKKVFDLIDRVTDATDKQDMPALLIALKEANQFRASNLSIWEKMNFAARAYSRILPILGLLFILLILFYAPYSSTVTIRGRAGQVIAQYDTPLGHYWIWDSPSGNYNYDSVQPKTSEPHIDIEHLFIYMGIGLVVTVFGAILTRQKLWRADSRSDWYV